MGHEASQGAAKGAFGTPVIHPTAWVHPTAVVIGNVTLEADVSVWPGAVLRGDVDAIRVGAGSNVQDGAVLHCDAGKACLVGARVTVGHRAVVHGCTVEDGALIGIGAVVLNGAVIGAGTLVAAGAVVAEGRVLPSDVLVAGVPAQVVRALTPEQRQRVANNSRTYIELKERYRTGAPL
jgi:carbonic anhydrase/acetyltransferase-like protein (isoleucine patch superfamily)